MEVCDFIQLILYLRHAYYACIYMYHPIWFYMDFIHHGFYMEFIHHGFYMDFIHHGQYGLYTSPDVYLFCVVFNCVFYCFINMSVFVSNDEIKIFIHSYIIYVFFMNVYFENFVATLRLLKRKCSTLAVSEVSILATSGAVIDKHAVKVWDFRFVVINMCNNKIRNHNMIRRKGF